MTYVKQPSLTDNQEFFMTNLISSDLFNFEDCLQPKYFAIFLSSITCLLIDYFTTCSFS